MHDDCGLHDSIAREDPHFTLEDEYCPVAAAAAQAGRVREKAEHDAEHELPAGAKRAGDGRTTRIRLLSPSEIAKMSDGSAAKRR